MKKILMFLVLATACFGGYKESFNEANKFYRDRDFLNAEEKYTEAISFENNVAAYLWRGKSRFELEKFNECMDDCHFVIMYSDCMSWMAVEASKYRYYCLLITDPDNYWLCRESRKDWLKLEDSIKFERKDDLIIISNIKNDSERNLISNIFTDFNYTISPQEGGDVVIKKKCVCGCNKKDFLSTCQATCTSVCYGFQIALVFYRDKIPGPLGTVASLALDFIEDTCRECCTKEKFWAQCYEEAELRVKDIGKKIDEWINKPDEKVWPTDIC